MPAGGRTVAEALVDDPLAQWKAMYSIFVAAIPGLASASSLGFQFTNPERTADWFKAARPESLEVLVDSRPASGGGFYFPGSTRISQGYELFLAVVDPGSAGARKLVKKAFDDYQIADAAGPLQMGIAGDPSADYENWRRGLGNQVIVTIRRDTQIENVWNIGADGQIQARGFAISGAGEVLDEQILTESYALTIRYDAMQAYALTRDTSWWNGGLVSALRHAGYTNPLFTQRTFFGPSGLLSLVPTSVVVAYNLVLSLRVARAFYHEHRVDLEGSGAISLGPFKLNANVAYGSTDTSESLDVVTINYGAINREPMNFGVFSDRLVVDAPPPA